MRTTTLLPLLYFFFVTTLSTLFLPACASERAADAKTNDAVAQAALAAVARRINGYNAHDLPAFLAAHAEDVDIIEYPDQQIGIGHKHLTFVFADQFERGHGHIEVLHQITVGNRVISHEHITVDERVERLVIVYTVEAGLITSFRLIE